jgi:hypothetical protein
MVLLHHARFMDALGELKHPVILIFPGGSSFCRVVGLRNFLLTTLPGMLS